MKPRAGTGPPASAAIQVRREFEGNRLARDSQARAYQKVLPVVRRSQSSVSLTAQLGEEQVDDNLDHSLVSQEGVAA